MYVEYSIFHKNHNAQETTKADDYITLLKIYGPHSTSKEDMNRAI